MYSIGKNIKVTIFGQSHSLAIGTVIDGLPAGIKIDTEKISAFMKRRAPGRGIGATPRKETDEFEIVSGLADGVTCGSPICAIIRNSDTKSADYENLRYVPRPGHSDFAAYMKFGGNNDIRGGGQFSGRMTAPLCFAGALCMQILEEKGISIGTHIASVHGICDEKFDDCNVNRDFLQNLKNKDFCVIDDSKSAIMKEEIERASFDGDSVGGTVECCATGLPYGLGDALFSGMESRISEAVFAIPAVKGIEFGAGFSAADMFGSENNDEFYFENGTVKTKTNNHGGILGGISSGMPLIFRVAVKPTPSIFKEQKSVDLKTGEAKILKINGRHDACIVPRALPCVEAALAIVILDMMGD